MTKEYTTLHINGYITKKSIDDDMNALAKDGWVIVPVMIKNSIMIFERPVNSENSPKVILKEDE